VGKCTDNGLRLLSLASAYKLRLTNTFFQHRKCHSYTWKSNDGKTLEQIDYILVNQRWASSVSDSRVYRGADVFTDHRLVMMKMRLRLSVDKRQKSSNHRLSLNHLSQPEVQQRYQACLQNRFNLLNLLESEPQEHCDFSSFAQATLEAASEAIPVAVNRRYEAWVSAETLALIDQRRAAQHQEKSLYNKLNRAVKKAIRMDRERHWAHVAERMEHAMLRGDMRSFYQVLNSASGRSSLNMQSRVLKSDGTPCRSDEEVLEQFALHFERLLNNQDPDQLDASLNSRANVAPAAESVNYDSPTLDEVSRHLCRLKLRKAAGIDGIAPELLRYGGEHIARVLHRIITAAWESETAPQEWKDAMITPIYKRKGSSLDTANYRGISLLSVAGKIYCAILHSRFQDHYESICRQNQAGFRKGRGCAEQIFVTRQVIERRYAHRRCTVLVFVDFKAAFDSVHRTSLWKVLLAAGLPTKLVNLIKDLYNGGSCVVKGFGGKSRSFRVKTGVRQGCILSPCLFNLALDWVMRRTISEVDGVLVAEGLRISDLDYADDIALLAENAADAQSLLNRLATYGGQIGLRINAGKTEFMTMNTTDQIQLLVNDTPIKQVSDFKYLGSIISNDGKAKKDIQHRISNAIAVSVGLNKSLWSRPEISVSTKTRVYNAAVLSVLLYGADSWPLTKETTRQLEVFQNQQLRRILGKTRRDRISTVELRRRASDQQSIENLLRKRRLQMFGHAARMAPERLPHVMVSTKPPPGWKKRPGGQVKNWQSNLFDDFRHVHQRYTIKDALQDAQNPAQWRGMIRDILRAPKAKGRALPYRR
jgi:hypothetical protein